MERILVTGGLGFIGRTLLSYLLKRSDVEHIDVVDNLSNSQFLISDPLVNNPKIRVSTRSVQRFVESGQAGSYSQIYHLASPVGPAGVLNYAGTMGPMIVADANSMAQMALSNSAKLLDISTSEVYGHDPGDIPQKEDIDKVVPSNITIRLEYGVSKLLSEVFMINLAKVTPLKVNLVRPFNIVGVGQKGEVGFVLPRFVEAALAGTPLTVFDTGEQKRTFTSVKDFVEGIIMVMNSDVNGEIFNIGNAANLCSVLDLAKMVVRLTGSKSEISLVDPRDIYGPNYAEAWNKIPDCTKIMTTLGWRPTRSLEDIVKEVIQSYKE